MSTRAEVLRILEAHRGACVSGEELAGRLGLSRAAVWKAVDALRQEGFAVEAVRKKGYRLGEGCDRLSLEGMAPLLEGCGARLHFYPTLPSTSLQARQLALQGAPHGTVVLAEAQSAGRGRAGRPFYSPPGGLYMSLVLREGLTADTAPLCTLAAAAAVCGGIEALTPLRLQIKWVNDILLGGKKICGILTEAITDLESGGIECVVVGIGINFSAPPAAFPAALRDRAGALFPHYPAGAGGVTRNRLAAEILRPLLAWARSPAAAPLIGPYREHSAVIGRDIWVLAPGGSYRARALDIDGQGGLVVQPLAGGPPRVLRAGEISILPPGPDEN